MASLLTGSDKLLEIRTTNVNMVIASKGRQVLAVYENGERSSSLRVVGIKVESISFPLQEMGEEYSVHQGVTVHEFNVRPMFFEQTDYIVTIRSRNGEALEFVSNSSLIEGKVDRVFEDDPTLLSGVINFGNNVGFSDLTVYADRKEILSVRLEVYPSKVSYKEDYRAMMTDINNMVSESVLDFMKKAYQLFVSDHKRNNTPAVFFTVLQGIYDKYYRAMNRILAVPHHKLVTEQEVLPYYRVRKTNNRSRKWLEKHPEYVQKMDGRFHAERILAVKKQITYDTQENRIVKFMLKSTVRKIRDFTERYENTTQNPEKRIMDGANRMSKELERILSTTFLAEVSEYDASQSMSLVFGMAPGYRELYKYYLMLQNGISVGGNIFKMSVRETAQLYEYWCFIKLYDILRSRYTLQSPDIIKVNRTGVTVDLAKGETSKVAFLNTKTGERIYLSYNPSESKTQTVNQRPDNILELEKKGSKATYKYVFDAKYRIEMNPDGKYYPDKNPGPKLDDINTMHRYRDAIVFENTESKFTFEKTMFGAYILFPYTQEEVYRDHRFYKSIETVNIGGLPFLPSATSLVTQLLDELISDSAESAFERASLPIGIEEHLNKVDWETRDVLIGFVPDQEHLDLFLNNKMYFTRKFDTKNLPIRYLALYEKKKGIFKYGEVISWRKAVRNTLPGRSRFSDKEYHVFEVLDWTTLETPITVKESGPDPISYTNHFLLMNSMTYPELLLKNEEEYRFFTELKRRMDKTIIGKDEDTTVFEVDDIRVWVRKTGITVYKGDREVGTYSVQEFSKSPNATFRRIMRVVKL